MSSDYQLEDTLYLPFTTRAFATGIPTALVSGAIDIYEDVTATPIVTGETLTVSLNSVAGFNMITVTATAATGFGAGQSYTAILQAGTVGGVSVVGEVVAHFTLDKSAAAKDLANGTDGLGALKAETALIVADTGELQIDWANGGRLDLILDIVAADTTTDIPALIAALNDLSAAQVNTEVLDVMNVDTITLPGQEAPPLAPTHRQAVGWLYKVFRNRKDQTSTLWQLYADNETTVDAKATVSDDATTAIKQEIVTGP